MTATALARPQIVIIVAAAENGVIGRHNTIPWKLKADQQRLKALTMGKPIVMGRKTFESLRRPLPGRTNIVITRDANYRAPGAIVTNSFEDALVVARVQLQVRLLVRRAVAGHQLELGVLALRPPDLASGRRQLLLRQVRALEESRQVAGAEEQPAVGQVHASSQIMRRTPSAPAAPPPPATRAS